jgi:hypothetical protein
MTPDRQVVISLDESAARLTCFRTEWGYRIRWFHAHEPATCPAPRWWMPEWSSEQTRLAFWCNLRSHMDVLEQAIVDNVQHLLVFEDDARKLRHYDSVMTEFYDELPKDFLVYKLHGWSGQHVPITLSQNYCERVIGTGGMQAVGYSYEGMRTFYDWIWRDIHGLSDTLLGKFSERYPVYAPVPWTVGHDPEKSIIKGTE